MNRNFNLNMLLLSLLFIGKLSQANDLAQIDSQLPTFLWASPANNSKVRSVQKTDIEQAARQHLARYAKHYQLTKTAQSTAKLEHIHAINDKGYIVRFGQQVNNIEVFNGRINLLLDRSLQLVAISGNLAPQVTTAHISFKWEESRAIASAFQDLHQETLPTKQLTLQKQRGVYQWYEQQSPLPISHKLSKPVRIKKLLFPLANGLEPAYYLELSTVTTAGDPEKADFAYIVSATDGRLLSRSNMALELTTPFTYRVWADETSLLPYDSAFGNDQLSPLPSVPLTLPATPVISNLLTLSCGPISTCDPWLPATATESIGNNVEAYADLKPPNGFSPGDIHATLSSPTAFDYGYAFSVPDNLKHAAQLQAAIVQAFYTTNFMHDWLYNHGFDEQAGNGQANNFQRGGIEGDPMHVEVNDFREKNNSNMVTPRDGASATMQLYPWTHEITTLLVNINGQQNSFSATSATFGPPRFKLAHKDIVLLNDGVDASSPGGIGSVNDGCQTPLVNATDLAGAIALIDRGDCKFAEKAKIAQDVGAIAVLIANNRPEAMITMNKSGNPTIDRAISIPILGIDQAVGDKIKQALTQSTITVTMSHKKEARFNSALDNTIVIHEWGHFLTNRLVTLNNNQGNSMGEGWSDFLALLTIVKEQDRNIPGNEQFQATYAIGQYISPSQPTLYPFGIRRYPYSTDFSKNPLTFKHISNSEGLPSGVPVASTADLTGSNNSELHNSGEVWASMLWEAYVALLNDTTRLTFNEAQNRMLDYLVASLKMTPVNPTFLEARDALLAVAKVRDAADYALFWQAFAKRGAGIGAIAPRRFSVNHTGVVEDFHY